LIEDGLGHAGAGDDVADPCLLESALGELRRSNLQKL